MRGLLIVCAALALVGCAKPEGAEDRVVTFKDDDAAMNAAMEKARGSVQTFIDALGAPRPNQSGFAIKYGFPYDPPGEETNGREHMWLSDVKYDGATFHAVVANEAVSATDVKLGQHVDVAPSEISDWMYLQDGKLIGGETIRVMVGRMSPEERKEFDATAPFEL